MKPSAVTTKLTSVRTFSYRNREERARECTVNTLTTGISRGYSKKSRVKLPSLVAYHHAPSRGSARSGSSQGGLSNSRKVSSRGNRTVSLSTIQLWNSCTGIRGDQASGRINNVAGIGRVDAYDLAFGIRNVFVERRPTDGPGPVASQPSRRIWWLFPRPGVR